MTVVDLATIAGPIVAALVGFGQIAVIWYGIRAMIGVNNDRAEGAAEAARRADARHTEAMAAHADNGSTRWVTIGRTPCVPGCRGVSGSDFLPVRTLGSVLWERKVNIQCTMRKRSSPEK